MMLTGRDVEPRRPSGSAWSPPSTTTWCAAAVETGQRIAGLSQPGIELTKKSLQAGIAASSLEAHLTSEGLGQLYLRLLTDNFEEATRARKEGRDPVFRDRR